MTTEAGRPIPIPDEESQEFFNAAKEGRLLLRYCSNCDRYLGWDRDICDECHNYQLDWREASGKGTIYTFTIVHQVITPAFANEVPYNVTYVELEEGPRVKTNVVGVPHNEIEVGLPVRVVFEALSDEVTVPKFEIAR
jgi:uncharacterized OB-fold protein